MNKPIDEIKKKIARELTLYATSVSAHQALIGLGKEARENCLCGVR